ncbi:MAG: sensor domain-containing diguanylate cyclase [Candidatus Omnitrophota bacterium]
MCFYLVNIVLGIYLFNKYLKIKGGLDFEIEGLQEKINIVSEENAQESKNKIAFQEKIRRYRSLKEIIENINQNLELEYIANSLTSTAFSFIAKNKGTCIFYLSDKNGRLTIYKAKKEDKGLIIKDKEGDTFDSWVVRHVAPLFIEDIKRDFRFDLDKLAEEDARPISSLISAPLVSDHRLMGVLRLDNQLPAFYSQDDLRFLTIISDLGAVALENGELFQKTQDLAIHDGLTALYTKGYFMERLKEECKRSMRQNSSFTLLMLDIDYFKKYNDQFGHTAGDLVLKTLSFTMANYLKEFNTIISRFGGEEFCVILSHMDKRKARAIAEDLRARIENAKVTLRRQETNITVSIGLANFPADAKDETELILKSDKAMYEAKQKGRNRVCSI